MNGHFFLQFKRKSDPKGAKRHSSGDDVACHLFTNAFLLLAFFLFPVLCTYIYIYIYIYVCHILLLASLFFCRSRCLFLQLVVP